MIRTVFVVALMAVSLFQKPVTRLEIWNVDWTKMEQEQGDNPLTACEEYFTRAALKQCPKGAKCEIIGMTIRLKVTK